MIEAYYAARGLDAEGMPTAQQLAELRIETLVR
jgi:aldehyde:ferredoxin oxidoreductase